MSGGGRSEEGVDSYHFSVDLGKSDVLRAISELHELLDGAFPGRTAVLGENGGGSAVDSGAAHLIIDADRYPAMPSGGAAPRTAFVLSSGAAGTGVEVCVPSSERVLGGLGGVVERAVRALAGLPRHELDDRGRREAAMRRAFAAPSSAAVPPDGDGPAEGFVGRFGTLARRHPDRLAVSTPGTDLTYAELAGRAAALSAALRDRGLGRGSRVLVLPRRDEHLVAVLLAAFRAGAAVSLVDPRHPDPYLGACAKALSPDLVIDLAGRGAALNAVPVMDSAQVGAAESAPAPPFGEVADEFSPDDCAVVTFTSGTTGEPKAVAGRYGSLTRFYDWMDRRFGPLAGVRFGMCSALGHDPLQRDVMTPLFLGGTVVVPEEDLPGRPAGLAEWLRRERIGAVCLNPVLLAAMDLGDGGLPDLRLHLSVGSPLTRDQALRLRRAAPRARILNLYGSTETQRAVAYFEVPRSPEEISGLPAVIPLGHGMKDVEALVVEHGGGAPRLPFETGEIALVSDQLALGYLNASETDRERFRDSLPGAFRARRAYLTGDTGHSTPDLGLIGLGRADGQVKISGHRVETAEVSAACRTHPLVVDAATVALDIDGLATLVSYVVPGDETVEFSPERFRSFLAELLPGHAVPHHIVTHRALPLTANHKIDLEALRRRARERLRADGPGATASGTDTAVEFVRRHTGLADPPEDVPLDRLGIGSLRFVALTSRLAGGRLGWSTPGPHPGMTLRELRAALSAPAARPEAATPAVRPSAAALAGLGPVTRVTGTEISFGERTLAHCCSNDYLGLGARNADPAVPEEFLASGLPFHSHGSSEVNAHTVWHQRLADTLCELHGTEAALLFSSAYLANTTALPALAGPGDHLLVDESVHRSLLDGCVLSGAGIDFFRHNDVGDLEGLLRARTPARRRIIVTEGLFGIEGDIPDLPSLHETAERHGCLMLLDEANSLGQLGPTGRGASEHFGGPVSAHTLHTGTLSKALGSGGGYITGPRELLDRMPIKRGAAYSTGLTPFHAFTAYRSARVLTDDGGRLVGRLRTNSRVWRESLRGLGLDTGSARSAIVPLLFADPAEVERHHGALLSAGIFGLPITPALSGTVSAVRTTVTAAHDPEALPHLAERIALAVGTPEGRSRATVSTDPRTGADRR
ncbi:8-amino-7-oxononanoate synthase [Nocardiopsis dassonvillei]|uniref:aminotransferase class I/II-fold pyridoxal phosphate-dependent enzyme n=1 Tax=Nocardiopsis dassonvillei TaxID=2014 RepID=UPI003F549B96